MGLFDQAGLRRRERTGDAFGPASRFSRRPARFSARGVGSSSPAPVVRAQTSDPLDRTGGAATSVGQLRNNRVASTPQRGMTIDELQKFLAKRGIAPLPTTGGLATRRTSRTSRNRRTTTRPRRAQSAAEGGARPTTSMTRAGVPTAQLGTLFGSPLNIPERVAQSLTGRQLTGGLFDIINAGRSAGISFPSTTAFRRLSPSERRAAQDTARLKGFTAEEFQAGILRSSPGERARPSLAFAPRRSRVRV